ncbi:MAG: GNAT family N-acetyltransferase [Vicinamibacteria bacterium]|nr:GNAT family N-acetyltransferase [Vicinamibacteria bacterium]
MGGHITRIRQATVADVDIIVQQRRGMFAEMGYGDEESRDAMAIAARPFVEAAIEDGSYRGWLAVDGDRVVAGGGLAIVSFQPTPLDLCPRRVWVLNMYTEPAYRRRGMARVLLQGMIRWCGEQGYKSMYLHASDKGRPLYESLGFRPSNEMRLVLEHRLSDSALSPNV